MFVHGSKSFVLIHGEDIHGGKGFVLIHGSKSFVLIHGEETSCLSMVVELRVDPR